MIRKAVALMIYNKHQEILLMQRGIRSRYESGKWELCGGAVEDNESFSQAAMREAYEELGMAVSLQEQLLYEKYSDMGDGVIWEVVVFKALAEDQPTIQEPEKCQALLWVSRDTLVKMKQRLATHLQEDLDKLGWT